MNIRIVKKSDIGVFFLSPTGEGCAQWCGKNLNSSEHYDVEIDFDKKYTWTEDIILNAQKEEGMKLVNGKNKVVSKVIDIENDVATMRLSDDIFFLEIMGFDFSNIGEFVEFESDPNETRITPFFL